MTVNELINQYTSNNIIEDGYASPPPIYQSPNETGAWVRSMRPETSGIWFMVNQEMNSQVIYPGNVILVDREREFTRRMIEIPFSSVERKSLRLDAKYSNEVGNSTEMISNFTRADVKHFVDACLTKYKNGSHDLGSNTQWQFESTDRKEGITLGGSIKGVEFAGNVSKNQTVTVAYLKQEMYTVSLNNEYSTPSDIFTDRVDVEKFKNNIALNRGTPAIIDAVKYGRIIAIWAVQEGKEAITLSVKDFKLSIGKHNKTAKFYLRVYGGIAGSDKSDKFFMSDGSEEEIKKILSNMKEVGKEAMETAMPMEYSVKFLRDMTANVLWRNLPYYKTYIPKIKFKVTEHNWGASMQGKVHFLNYTMFGDKNDYCREEKDLGWIDGDFYCSPKSLCIDIIIEVLADKSKSFNIMLPCVPYDFISGPNDDGEWVFQVDIKGKTVFDVKNFSCNPSVAGAVLSKSKEYYMKAYDNSPLNRFNCAGASEEVILQEYINWMNSFTGKKDVEYKTNINNIHELRPYFSANPPKPVTPDPPKPVTPDPPKPVTPDPPTPVTPPEPKKPGDLIVFKHVGVSDNQMEYTIIDDNSVSFHERIVSKNLNKIISNRPDVNFSHYRGQVEILEKVKCQDKIYNVVQLGSRANYKGAFYQALEVNKVSVPGTVTVLFNKTFYNCVNLTSVILHEGLKEIEGDCFFKCLQLSSITIPDSVSTIGKCAFNGCVNLAEVTIGKNINNLDSTFQSCKLLRKVTCRAITPPIILINPFEEETYHFGELLVPYQSLEQYKNHPVWGKFNKISYYDNPPKSETPDSPTPVTPPEPKKPGDLIVFKHVGASDNQMEYTIIDDNSVSFHERIVSKNLNKIISNRPDVNFSHYRGLVEILEKVECQNKIYNVVQLGSRADYKGAFYQALEVNKVSVPGTVTVLFKKTFYNCVNLTSVILHEGLKEIEGDCFFKCPQLSSITIPDSVSTIGKCAFNHCVNLAEVTIGKNINNLDGTFQSCILLRKVTCRAITPPNILINPFEEETYHFGELLVPYQSLEQYKNHPVWGKFNKISYYDNPPTTETPPTPETPKIENFVVDGIRYWVKDANAKVVYITDKLQGKYKDSIAIPQMVLHEGVIYQVLKIGNNAFKECTDLYAVNIPNTIKGVNDYAFADTPQLRSIHCYATTPPEVKPKGFDKVLFDKITLYVPKDTVSAYKSAEGWKNFVNILPLDS